MGIDGDDLSCLALALALGAGCIGCHEIGLWVRRRLPHRHRSAETTEVLHAVIAMLVTFSAIVLGLMVTSSKENFDQIAGMVETSAARIVQVDHILREYGTEAAPARAILARYAEGAAGSLGRPGHGAALDAAYLGALEGRIRGLGAGDAVHARLQGDALDRFEELLRLRWELLNETRRDSNAPFDIVLSIWLLVPFLVFGLNAERNLFVSIALRVSAGAIVAATFVVFDMATPLGGLVSVSARPLREAAARIEEVQPSPPPAGLALPWQG